MKCNDVPNLTKEQAERYRAVLRQGNKHNLPGLSTDIRFKVNLDAGTVALRGFGGSFRLGALLILREQLPDLIASLQGIERQFERLPALAEVDYGPLTCRPDLRIVKREGTR